ncbi:D-glycero-beta-D-manno-heptose-7-phosphate kinase [Candidatus Protochlamydia phocaeensis]|uniref:D-glycero-beta-D-manno-heptose-7-phosphate kinase n=1 Tax=Candidatus Protochlamydia phocaeensis TaxID=1414722 RepID=UPI00083809B0|nr:D-glycero-beta-D-manno-heptose-7-phosphate kinase [Candidatus Protochlamydia phocaeensis]
MVKLANILGSLNPAKVMVVGDMLLDSYTVGKARRISPEAPVAVIHVHHEEHRPGGAGNVILNLISLGATVIPLGRIGKDWAGDMLCKALQQEGVGADSIFVQESYRTPVKNRIIADNQQIVRVDFEQAIPLSGHLEEELINALPALMQDVKIIALSDYGKGFLTPKLTQAIIQQAKERQIIVITDPKGQDFSKYQGTTIIKPNLSEVYAAAGMPAHAPLEDVSRKVLQITQAQMLMVTRSEAGISVFEASGARQDFPVHAKEVKDVTGAGDTVLAMLAYALANQLSYAEAAQLCNVAAGIAIEHVGCARVSLSDLAHRLFESDMCHKVFDRERLFVLREVLKKKPFHILVVSSGEMLTPKLFQTIKQLTNDGESLLVYIKDPQPSQNFIDMLASLREVSFILIHQENMNFLSRQAHPLATYEFNEHQLRPCQLTSSLLESLALNK